MKQIRSVVDRSGGPDALQIVEEEVTGKIVLLGDPSHASARA